MARISLAQLNEWWGNCGFDEMADILGYKFYEFSPEDGYQEYVDFCDNWWNSLTYNQKLSVYKDHN